MDMITETNKLTRRTWREREREGEKERWSVFQDTMITWSWGSRKGGVEIAKSIEERGGLTEVGKERA